jgi:hypothetical protein
MDLKILESMFDVFPLDLQVGYLCGSWTNLDQSYEFFDGRSVSFDFDLNAAVVHISGKSGQAQTGRVTVNVVSKSDSLNEPSDNNVSARFHRNTNENTSSCSEMQ